MRYKPKTHDEYIKLSLLRDHKLVLMESRPIETIKLLYHHEDEYEIIRDLMNKGQIEAIRDFSENKEWTFSDIEIIRFLCTDGKEYLGSVYDSWELWQNPEVMYIVAMPV